jgi:hypothetical protein
MDERVLQSVFPHLPPSRIRLALTATGGNISLASNILLEPEDVERPCASHAEGEEELEEDQLSDLIEVSSQDVISIEEGEKETLQFASVREESVDDNMSECVIECMTDDDDEDLAQPLEEDADRLFDDVLYSQFSQTSTHSPPSLMGKTSSIRALESIEFEPGRQRNAKSAKSANVKSAKKKDAKTKKDAKEREKLSRQVEGLDTELNPFIA